MKIEGRVGRGVGVDFIWPVRSPSFNVVGRARI